MKIKSMLFVIMLCLGMLFGSASVFAGSASFEVTITNLTRGVTFTPILVASHKKGVKLFELGDMASDELAALAEGGAVGPLATLLDANSRVIDIADSGGLLAPGASVTVTVDASGGAKQVSVASMLIPTNDAFFSLNGVKAPRGNKTVVYLSPAYDAGSEPNDENCLNIPGPDCGAINGFMGEGGTPGVGGEDYVHIHAGIHGIGDLAADMYDWRNPVAKITIRRTN